jgi:hypothetical protein
MKKIKFLIATLFVMFFIVSMTDAAYAYTVTLTNKIEGKYNDKSQAVSYFIPFGDVSISINGDKENLTRIDFYACNCGLYFTNGAARRIHDPYNFHGWTKWYNAGYTFTLANGKSATIAIPNNMSIEICRIYDSNVAKDNQTVTYSKNNGKTRKPMANCDIRSEDGISGIEISSASTITVYNADDSSINSGAATTDAATSSAAKPKLNKTKAAICVGKTVKLKVTNYKSSKVTWSSSNKKVATVTSNGKVKGIKAGTVTITAKVGKKTVKARVTVKKKGFSLF